MPSIIQPLLDGLEDYTDMTYIMVVVRAPQQEGGKYEAIS
jgi:hypothetical protein